MRALLLLLGLVEVSCGDNTRQCQSTYLEGIYVGEQYDRVCTLSVLYAARDTTELVPTQVEIDRYYERLGRIAEVEPLMKLVGPQRYRASHLAQTPLLTKNPSVIVAWSGVQGPAPPTGDADFDNVIFAISSPYIWLPGADRKDGEVEYLLGFDEIFSEEVLHQRLTATSSRLPDINLHLGGGDATWHWIDANGTGTDQATVELEARIGWEDCFVACTYFHFFRAVAPPDEVPMVYDLGGDPLPDYMQPQPTTKPPP